MEHCSAVSPVLQSIKMFGKKLNQLGTWRLEDFTNLGNALH